MKVLIACECSGIIRDAFIKRGHKAVSCDLKPTKAPGPHLQCNVLDILGNGWDLMIGHPPCTDLAVSGARWFNTPSKLKGQKTGAMFFLALYNAPIPKICLENPVGVMSTLFRKPDQYLDMLMFGHGQTKKTGLWLKNLPPLTPPSPFKTPVLEPINHSQRSFGHHLPPSENRGELRSVTFLNVAFAMAEQWG